MMKLLKNRRQLFFFPLRWLKTLFTVNYSRVGFTTWTGILPAAICHLLLFLLMKFASIIGGIKCCAASRIVSLRSANTWYSFYGNPYTQIRIRETFSSLVPQAIRRIEQAKKQSTEKTEVPELVQRKEIKRKKCTHLSEPFLGCSA